MARSKSENKKEESEQMQVDTVKKGKSLSQKQIRVNNKKVGSRWCFKGKTVDLLIFFCFLKDEQQVEKSDRR